MFFILQKVKFPCPWIPASTLGINRIQTRLVCRLEISPFFFFKSISKTGFWLCSCLTAFLWLIGITDNDSLHCVKHWTPAMIVVFPSVLDNSISQHVHLVVNNWANLFIFLVVYIAVHPNWHTFWTNSPETSTIYSAATTICSRI